MTPDLLNFKKGWMSKLDENGEWKKHWFVLTDAGLRYYRDSGAEEKDDLDGEIDLKSCVKVSEFDVQKNYGFQLHTRNTVITLSAMTAGIRRNWIEVLKKNIQPSSSPDLTRLPDSNSDKENSQHSRSLSSSRRLPSHSDNANSTAAPSSNPPHQHRRFDYVELSPVTATTGPGSSGQREAGEGQVKAESGSWREESRDATSSQWEAVLSRKGVGQGGDGRVRIEDEIERKWAEFERLPLREMRSLPSMGSHSGPGSDSGSGPVGGGPPSSEALQREVASLRQQLELLRKGGEGGGVRGGKEQRDGVGDGGIGGGGECGPLASCGKSLRSMELAHRHALEELQRLHARELLEMQQERDRLLQEETQATTKAMEVLKKAHHEELDRELEKARRRASAGADTQALGTQQRAEVAALERELQGLSERYSQKCLELSRVEQSGEERQREVGRKVREMELLKQENQDLQARLTEEINRMRTFVSGKELEGLADSNRDRKACEMEVLLRVKENEVQYLQKEISCLRNEMQCLNLEKHSASERCKEMHEELSGMKSRSDREIQSLREHLKLAMAALQEGQRLGNSLEH
ncbi:TRIO and F-actin binding protein b [Engraulis encrasicolus]|uniref:TRIO and F-actin binding protein b n=1 Tax=Engraulis encrasicolus TaxID=184585 RepID=UPI002FD3711D